MSVTVRDPLKLSPDFGAMRREELQVYVAKCPSSDTVFDASTAGLTTRASRRSWQSSR